MNRYSKLKKDTRSIIEEVSERNAQQKRFQGDGVVIMFSTDANTLLMQWKGSFKTDKKMGLNDFKIKIDGKCKVYHANMLLKYTKREVKNNRKCH